MRQIKREEVRLLLYPTNDNQRFAKIRLPIPRRMAQRHKHLLADALPGTHIVFYNRIATIKPAFVAQPLKYPFGCVSLFAWPGLVLGQPLVNLASERIKLGPLDRRSPPAPRRLRVRQHLRDTISADPKTPSNLTPAQPFFKVSVTNLQVQIHGEYPQALPSNERAKWPTFTPPRHHNDAATVAEYCSAVHIKLHNKDYAYL